MEDNHFKIGQVVRATKGRDQNRIFIIVGKVDEEYVLIADGDLRRIEKPKKKKIKHLAKFNIISHEVKDRIQNEKKMNNAFIRRELERLGVKSLD
ncbi:KOW domain-containing RNA-binding protein [Alkaliphilus hydrothermalis]|uniref:Ribosomal protein L14E/L6E/L27E n=1 Tax=Alkaliphilus hydrothermalis TaxID=1482730 RepID=A0ABS2NQR8_9FIRM|nr:KOW domain-containing RNA-binding protein [Alkaliphilus hydrothermalis]MBM7615280.1 ribosomal protein L14E/L6E/L27E [Alkaliphilus hydrothermalis]